MSSRAGAEVLFNAVKTIVDNYLSNRKMAAIVIGIYNGSVMMVNEQLPVPMSLVTGNMKGNLAIGDKVRLIRNDGGGEYYILEIVDKPYLMDGEGEHE